MKKSVNAKNLNHIMTFESFSEKYDNGEMMNEGFFDSKKTKVKKELETIDVEDDAAVDALLYKLFASNQIPGAIKRDILPTATNADKIAVIKQAVEDKGDGILVYSEVSGAKKLAYKSSDKVNWATRQHTGGSGE